MSEKAFLKLWSFIALTLIVLSSVYFLRMRGVGVSSDPFGFLGYLPSTIAAVALPIDLFLLTSLLCLCWVWSTQVGGTMWAQRIPVFHFDRSDVDGTSLGGKIYQGILSVVLICIPMLFTASAAKEFYEGSVYAVYSCKYAPPNTACDTETRWKVERVARGRGHFDFLTLMHSKAKGATLRFGQPDKAPEYLIWTPWVYGVWIALVTALFILVARSVFWPVRRASSD